MWIYSGLSLRAEPIWFQKVPLNMYPFFFVSSIRCCRHYGLFFCFVFFPSLFLHSFLPWFSFLLSINLSFVSASFHSYIHFPSFIRSLFLLPPSLSSFILSFHLSTLHSFFPSFFSCFIPYFHPSFFPSRLLSLLPSLFFHPSSSFFPSFTPPFLPSEVWISALHQERVAECL